MKIQIRNRWTYHVIYECDAESLTLAVERAAAERKSLRGAVLRDADLAGAVLRGAILRDADLAGADLTGADFTGAAFTGGLDGVPRIDNIHQKVYEAAARPQALDMRSWHTCNSTHCRAGWIVTLAGEAGKAMEYCLGTPAAAALIYLRSDPKLGKVPDFYASNDDALADMKRLAKMEAAK